MIKKFFTHFMPSVLKPLRVIWNQVIGFMFLVFAVFALRHVYKSLSEFNGDGNSIFRLAISGIFGLIMGIYGLASFWRARKISRS
jgi:hypothetical protein